MASKIILEEKDGGLLISGQICGHLTSIMEFADASIQAILDETYNAAVTYQPRPGIDREAVSVFCAIRVMKNAFNTFAEKHADAFEQATAYDGEFEDMLKTEKGAL